jgi:mono/diheme cytochrome c family protein
MRMSNARHLAFGMGLVVLLIGCSEETEAPVSSAELYQSECGSCHGKDGVGTKIAPQIQSPVSDYASHVVRNGRGEMGFTSPMEKIDEKTVNDEALNGIFDYLGSIPKPKDGAGLYTRFCGNCHGVEGSGGRTEIAIAGASPDFIDGFIELVRSGVGEDEVANRTEYMPARDAKTLSDAEISLIIEYLSEFQ